MASLKLTVEEFSEGSEPHAIDRQAFGVLDDYLQPSSNMSLEAASTSILSMLPGNDLKELSILSLSELCIELAEQIPYSHPSQMKLVRLLQQVAQSPKVVTSVSTSFLSFHSQWGNFLKYNPLVHPSSTPRRVSARQPPKSRRREHSRVGELPLIRREGRVPHLVLPYQAYLGRVGYARRL